MGNFLPIGERLRSERERLGMSQDDFAGLVGVTRKTLFGYESGARAPDAGALNAWAAVGLDVLYVVTGRRSSTALPSPLPADEQMVLDGYRGLGSAQKRMLLASLLSGDIGKPSSGISVRGSGNHTAGRDIHK